MTEAAFPRPPDASSSGRDASPVRNRPERAGPPVHWMARDVAGDLLAIARRAGAAEPVEIRVRPEVYRDLQGTGGGDPLTHLDGIPVVVDPELPFFPGYEVHRTPGSRAS
jgi:hypothetical protein